jgi:hypothetical protein
MPVKGKSDDAFTPMMIWNDASCPNFCLPGWRSTYLSFILPDADGYLFPYIDKKTREMMQEKWLYQYFVNVIQFIVKDILKEDTAKDKAITVVAPMMISYYARLLI